MRRTFHILTFGCQMNVNDSDWLARALTLRGFEPAAVEEAAITIINTCSVREKPEQKVYSTLGRIRQLTADCPGAFSAVIGCVAQQIGTGFFDSFPQVRLVAGGDGLPQVPEALELLVRDPRRRISLVGLSSRYLERDAALPEHVPPTAYVTIMQGCDNFCAYCIVPYTRGRQKSRTAAAILQECRALVERGAREITLLGQNVNAFGQDTGGDGTTFPELLRHVAALPGLERLRFVSPHPKDFPPELIRAFGDLECLCPRLHLPLQAGSDHILQRMGRRYGRDRYLEIVRSLRAVRPDMEFSTDLIVGFPGEREEDFLETCSLVEEVGFISSFSFCYSPRPGTRAALMPDNLPQETKQERLSRLQTLQDRIGQRRLQLHVGQLREILLEGESRRREAETGNISMQGHDPYGITVNLSLPPEYARPGLLIPARITLAKKHSLLAEATASPR